MKLGRQTHCIKGLACLTTPVINPSNGRLDTPLLGTALTRAGGNSGYSNLATPATISGFNGSWTEINPILNASGSPTAGILCMRSGYGSSGFLQFTRRDGTTPPTGAWDMAGQNVTNINNLGSTALNNTGAAAIGGALGVAGQTSTNGLANTGNVTNSGTWTNNGNATVYGQANLNGINNTGSITNTGNVTANMLQLNGNVTAGVGCTQNGMQARTSTGSVISCIGGIWTPPVGGGTASASCTATSVTFGAGCRGTLAGTTSGNTQSVAVTYGSGFANYSCSNGSWGLVSGSCTLPAANCNIQSVSWSAGAVSCSGTTQFMSNGQASNVASTNGNSGSVVASCSNGSVSLSSPVCAQATTSYSYPTDDTNNRYLSFNPNNLAVFCQSKGKNAIVATSVAENRFSKDIWICGAFNASLECSGITNCTNPAWAADGCWIIKTAVCTP